MGKKKHRCHKCSYNNEALSCDMGNDNAFMTSLSHACKDFESHEETLENKEKTELAQVPDKPKVAFFKNKDLVYLFHE